MRSPQTRATNTGGLVASPWWPKQRRSGARLTARSPLRHLVVVWAGPRKRSLLDPRSGRSREPARCSTSSPLRRRGTPAHIPPAWRRPGPADRACCETCMRCRARERCGRMPIPVDGCDARRRRRRAAVVGNRQEGADPQTRGRLRGQPQHDDGFPARIGEFTDPALTTPCLSAKRSVSPTTVVAEQAY